MSAPPFTSITHFLVRQRSGINSQKVSSFHRHAVFFDILIIMSVIYSILFAFQFRNSYVDEGYLTLLLPAFVSLAYVCLQTARRGYAAREYRFLNRYLPNILICWSGALLLAVAVSLMFGAGAQISRDWLAASYVFGLALLPLGRIGVALTVKDDLAEAHAFSRNVYMINDRRDAASAAIMRTAFAGGMHVVGVRYLGDQKQSVANHEDFKALVEEIRNLLKIENVDEIYLRLSSDENERINNFAAAFATLPIRVLLISQPNAAKALDPGAIRLGDHVAVELLRAPISARGLAAKRVLDVVVATAALLALLPIIAMACAGIAIESGRPIIFRQNRKGVAALPFTIFKLRTMSVQENGDKIVQACKNDPRVTRFGAILRRTSIDELPQLLNVLRGDMSIVGPRPHALAHDTYYGGLIKEYTRRHNVKPGLTGWAQVNGFRGETKDLHAMSERIRHDIWYIENWSIWLDIQIIFKTAGCVLFQKQAY